MSQQIPSSYASPVQTIPSSPENQLATLTRVNADDLLNAFGVTSTQRGYELLRWLVHLPARRFARQVIALDERVGRDGLQAASAWMLPDYAPRTVVSGVEHLPREGPLLIVANHPGLCDTLMLFATIPRTDLLIVAADRPFLRVLPHTARQLLFVKEAASERLSLVRGVTRHLRAGGAVLTFPGGKIEPDPAIFPGAAAALANWSSSIALFARAADDLAIVPAIVSGVISARAQRHPLTRLRRRPSDREWLGATLQILFPNLRDTTVRLAFGAPIMVADSSQAVEASRAAIATARRLIEDAEQHRQSS